MVTYPLWVRMKPTMSETTQAIVPFVNVNDRIMEAYEAAYERPITLTADYGVHADSMPRVRAFAGNDDRGHGTFTQARTVAIETFQHRDETHYQRISTQELIDDVARAMVMATRDRYEGRDPDPERAL